MKRRDVLKAGFVAGILPSTTKSAPLSRSNQAGLLQSYTSASKVVKKGPLLNFEQAYRVMREEGLDGLIVSKPTNLFYLTGYYDHLGFRFDSPTMFALLSRDENRPISIVMDQFIYYFSVTDSNFEWNPDVYLFTGWDRDIEAEVASLPLSETKGLPTGYLAKYERDADW